MGSTDVALLGVLTFMALGLTWFAVRVSMLLWRMGAALLWLVIGILIWTNTLGSSTADPWTYVLALALLVMLSLWVGMSYRNFQESQWAEESVAELDDELDWSLD